MLLIGFRRVLAFPSRMANPVETATSYLLQTHPKALSTDALSYKTAPVSFLTWNVNGLSTRIRSNDQWMSFVNLIKHYQPDIICLQEVKLPAHSPVGSKRNDGQPRQQDKIKRNEKVNFEEFQLIDSALTMDFSDYNRYWSLSEWRYSGQLMLIKDRLKVTDLRYNIDLNAPKTEHSEDGRVIMAYFESVIVISTYSPNNGNDELRFERRRKWDKAMEIFFEAMFHENRQVVWTGDLNCAPEDIDLSHWEWFRSALPQLKNPEEFNKYYNIRDYMGYAGCTDAERFRFQSILKAGHLVDVFREFHPISTPPPVEAAAFTWRGHPGRFHPHIGKFFSKAMRLDHFRYLKMAVSLLSPVLYIQEHDTVDFNTMILSSSLLCRVMSIQILGYDSTRVNFFGSDHCPVVLYLRE